MKLLQKFQKKIKSAFYPVEQFVCRDCGRPFEMTKARCCIICGSQNIQKGGGGMIYKRVELDDKGRVLKCLCCGNEQHFDRGDYCIICGKPIINFCAHIQRDNFSTEFGPCSEASGLPLPGNARFCPFCGSETTFFLDGLLKPWQEESGGGKQN